MAFGDPCEEVRSGVIVDQFGPESGGFGGVEECEGQEGKIAIGVWAEGCRAMFDRGSGGCEERLIGEQSSESEGGVGDRVGDGDANGLWSEVGVGGRILWSVGWVWIRGWIPEALGIIWLDQKICGLVVIEINGFLCRLSGFKDSGIAFEWCMLCFEEIISEP